MNDANRTADADRNVHAPGDASTAGITRPSRASTAAAKSAWSNEKPATITTPASTNVRNISGTINRS
jgi:hypothetical protein